GRLPKWNYRRRRTHRRCRREDNRSGKKSVWQRRPAIYGRTSTVELRQIRTEISHETPNSNALPVSARTRGPAGRRQPRLSPGNDSGSSLLQLQSNKWLSYENHWLPRLPVTL